MWDIVAGALRRWSILLTAFVLMIGGIWFGGMLYAPDDGTSQNQQVAQSTAPQPKQVAQQNISSPAAAPSAKTTQQPSQSAPPHGQIGSAFLEALLHVLLHAARQPVERDEAAHG